VSDNGKAKSSNGTSQQPLLRHILPVERYRERKRREVAGIWHLDERSDRGLPSPRVPDLPGSTMMELKNVSTVLLEAAV